MGNTFSKFLSGFRHEAAVAGLMVLLTMASGGTAMAQSENSGAGLVGTWMIEVTLRNCDTGAALGAPVHSLVTFHRGGALSESAGPASFAVGQRSPGHGVWKYLGGNRYSQRFVNLLRFDTAPNLPGMPGFDPTLPVTPGFFAGWQTVMQEVHLNDADNFLSAGTNAFHKLDRTLYRTGCSTAVGRRFQ